MPRLFNNTFSIKRLFSLTLILLFLPVFVIQAVPVQKAQAKVAGDDCTEAKLRDLGVAIINCSEDALRSCSAPASSGADIKNLYMLGDSITYGASNDYRGAFKEKGIEVFINAAGGRSWIYGGGASKTVTPEGNTKSARLAVDIDAEAIKAANGIVVALGSNGGYRANPIEEILEKIRSINTTTGLKIWWVNLAVAAVPFNANLSFGGEFNSKLEHLSTTNGTPIVIDWLRAVNSDAKLEEPRVEDIHNYLGDALHPRASGKARLVKLVVDAVTGSGGASSGCYQDVEGDNQKAVFEFFVEKGYTPEQAAGIVGNMIHESGVEPMKYQGYYGEQKHSSAEVIRATSNGANGTLKRKGHGWGLVQWTPADKIINPLLESGRTYDEIDTRSLQLQFLWEQLEGTGVGNIISEKTAGNILKATTTVEEAAIAFAGYYERFRDSSTFVNVDGKRVRRLNLDHPQYQLRSKASALNNKKQARNSKQAAETVNHKLKTVN